MRRLSFLLILCLILPAFAQSKHPFTFEDMMKLKRVGEPVPSPDGKWVLFSAVDVDLAANKKTPHIWIVPLSTDWVATGASPDKARVGTGAPARPGQPEWSAANSSASERILIPDQDGDRPRWAPDGKRFAFISNKEGGSQVWIAEFDGAAGKVTGVHKLTSIATEAGGELWSPDGKSILFTSDIYPECDGAPEAAAACNAKKLKEVEDSKVKAIIFDRLLYRHWNAYKRGMRTHIFVVPAPTLPKTGEGLGTPGVGDVGALARDLTPGDYDAPVFSLGGQDLYAFSPDGQEICYTSNHDKVEATSTNNDLWTVPVNWPANATPADVLAKTKNITADNQASDSTPLYSPDGKYIAYRAQQRPGYESDRFRLMLYDRKKGARQDISESYDRWVGSFAWAPNSQQIYFASEFQGTSLIYRIDAAYDENEPPPLPTPPVSVSGSLIAGGIISSKRPDPMTSRSLAHAPGLAYDDDPVVAANGQILFTRNSVTAPIEIYSASVAGRRVQLTHVNSGILSQVDMQQLEGFWFKGANSDSVQGLLIRPPNFDPNKKYPVKFLIHGGPQGAWGDDWSYRWNPELFASPTSANPGGFVVIMINFHGSTGYGQKFIDAINGDWGGAPFEDLMKGLDYAEQHYPFIDKDRECALGASYGGYMANWILTHTDRFKCIVSHDGMFNPFSAWGTTEELWFNEWEFKGTPWTAHDIYNKWSPRNAAPNMKTPTLVVHGQLDYRLDVSEGLQLFTALQRFGVPSKMLYFPDEGHWVLKPQNSQLWYKTVNDWVDEWTKPRSQ